MSELGHHIYIVYWWRSYSRYLN